MTLHELSRVMLPWRTWGGLLLIGVMMLAALLLCRDRASGPQLLATCVTGLSTIGLWLAGKSSVEHSANARAAATAKEPAASTLATGAVNQ